MTETGRPLRILVVDDDPSMVGSLRDILMAKGHSVDVAQSGQEAIESAIQGQPDCVLMDVRMPGMNGFEAFSRIRDHSPESAIIFMSAFPGVELNPEDAGADSYHIVPKPLDIDSLLLAIQQITSATPVLIVDDDPGYCDALGDILEGHAFEVRSAGSVSEGLALYQQSPRQAIVLDMKLGSENGLDALREIKRLDPDAIVVLMTGYPEMQPDMAHGIDLNAKATFTKPFAPDELVQSLREAFAARPPPVAGVL